MKKLIVLFFLFAFSLSFSQSSTCAGSAAMCSGNQGPFVNTTGVLSFGSLGCLGSTPNPAWFLYASRNFWKYGLYIIADLNWR